MRALLLCILLSPLATTAQHTLTGVVRDSVTRLPMPGVNVILENLSEGTVTNAAGEFQIESKTQSARLIFSFVGFHTTTRLVDAGVRATIAMTYDPQSWEENPDHHVKANLELGYFGDASYAPYGAIANVAIQSVGQTRVDLATSFRYWKQQQNTGLEFSMSRDFNIPYLPTLLLGYKSLDYADRQFGLKQVRGLLTYRLPGYLGVDFGGAYNELTRIKPLENLAKEQHLNGIVGLTKVFSYDSFLKNWGFYSSINYNPDWTYYELGTYKQLNIKKFTSLVLMARYYNYGTMDGVLLSVRFRLFDTRYYCCHSWVVYTDEVNAMK